MTRDRESVRVVATNRKARRAFHVLESVECGIQLVGTEVKSLRSGQVSIAEAYGQIKRGELWLFGASIAEYSHGNIQNHVPDRPRKLLLHRRELASWHKEVKLKGVTIVPLRIYFKGHLVKVEMALVRGKKLYDRREDQKKRSDRREMERAMSRRR